VFGLHGTETGSTELVIASEGRDGIVGNFVHVLETHTTGVVLGVRCESFHRGNSSRSRALGLLLGFAVGAEHARHSGGCWGARRSGGCWGARADPLVAAAQRHSEEGWDWMLVPLVKTAAKMAGILVIRATTATPGPRLPLLGLTLLGILG